MLDSEVENFDALKGTAGDQVLPSDHYLVTATLDAFISIRDELLLSAFRLQFHSSMRPKPN